MQSVGQADISSYLFFIYNFRRGLSRQKCIYELKSLLLKLKSINTVKNWFNKFNYGRRSLKDEVREGRPKTVREHRCVSPAEWKSKHK